MRCITLIACLEVGMGSDMPTLQGSGIRISIPIMKKKKLKKCHLKPDFQNYTNLHTCNEIIEVHSLST